MPDEGRQKKNWQQLSSPTNRRMYSMVNQVMQTVSIMARCSLSLPFSPCRSGMVLRVMPIVDTMMKVMEIMLTT